MNSHTHILVLVFSLVMFVIRIRALVGVMIFFGYFLIYIVRYNLSVHIVDMAQLSARTPLSRIDGNKSSAITRQRTGNIAAIMNWNDVKMAHLFSAYHIGYCICFPIFHNVGDKLGPTWVVGIAGLTSGILNCLTPAAAYYYFWVVFAVRVVKGFCAGAMQPSMVQLLRNWVPPIERNHFMWAYCGITTGTFSTFFFCAAVQFYTRWAIGFYISGGIQVLWAVLWLTLVCDYPRNHPLISRQEVVYLNNAIGTIFTIQLTNSQAPWGLILKSCSFWTLCILNFGYAWLIISLCIHGPLFYARVAGYSIYSASILTGLPFLLRLILGTIIIHIFHWYKHNTEIRRIKHLRKYFIVVSHVIPGFLVASCWLSSLIPGPILLTIAVALTAAGMDLTLDLCYELSPNFVNSIITVIKIIGNFSGIIVSLSVGEVTQKFNNSSHVWKHIWCFHATILMLSGLVFLIWGDTHRQSWAAIRNRPPRMMPIVPKHSVMSNIMEVDEEDYSVRLANQYVKKKSFLHRGSMKISKI